MGIGMIQLISINPFKFNLGEALIQWVQLYLYTKISKGTIDI